MSKVVCAVSARMRSQRCPGKAMATLAGKPLLEHLFERLRSVHELDEVVLATSAADENKVLVQLAEQMGVGVFAGDEDDVLGRHVEVARRWSADQIRRCDFVSRHTQLIEHLYRFFIKRSRKAEYAHLLGIAEQLLVLFFAESVELGKAIVLRAVGVVGLEPVTWRGAG